jgi:phage minor structural protein
VSIRKYIGQNNYAGFRYGVNLKNSKRTYDSKAIVTKLIVPDNANQYAQNGFCSIARAGGNPSGENYVYDFSYYYNMQLLDKEQMHKVLYDSFNGGPGYYA